jgi:hypothetical protein
VFKELGRFYECEQNLFIFIIADELKKNSHKMTKRRRAVIIQQAVHQLESRTPVKIKFLAVGVVAL